MPLPAQAGQGASYIHNLDIFVVVQCYLKENNCIAHLSTNLVDLLHNRSPVSYMSGKFHARSLTKLSVMWIMSCQCLQHLLVILVATTKPR